MLQVFEPVGQVELAGGEVAGGDEAEDGVLNFGGEFGEGIPCAGAGDGVEFVEAQLIVEGERRRWRRGESSSGGGFEGGVEVGCEMFRIGPEEERRDGLEGRELRGG